MKFCRLDWAAADKNKEAKEEAEKKEEEEEVEEEDKWKNDL